jgi:hypothetical protein
LPRAAALAALVALAELLVRVCCAETAQADKITKAIVKRYLFILLLPI